jgi:hypothetical protein
MQETSIGIMVVNMDWLLAMVFTLQLDLITQLGDIVHQMLQATSASTKHKYLLENTPLASQASESLRQDLIQL